jgi:mRNA interferase HicA
VTLDHRTFASDNGEVSGNEFLRKLRALGKRRGIPVVIDAARGKGSHQTVYFGAAYTILRNPKDELKKGTLHGMCNQLGILANDL